MNNTSKEGLRHIGKAVAELEKAGWFVGAKDKCAFEQAYALLRKTILRENNSVDLTIKVG